jgi:hypothetical protein
MYDSNKTNDLKSNKTYARTSERQKPLVQLSHHLELERLANITSGFYILEVKTAYVCSVRRA